MIAGPTDTGGLVTGPVNIEKPITKPTPTDSKGETSGVFAPILNYVEAPASEGRNILSAGQYAIIYGSKLDDDNIIVNLANKESGVFSVRASNPSGLVNGSRFTIPSFVPAGTYTLWLQKESSGLESERITVSVRNSVSTPSITVTSPNGGETFTIGSLNGSSANVMKVAWQSVGLYGTPLWIALRDTNDQICNIASISSNYNSLDIGIHEGNKCANSDRSLTPGKYKIMVYMNGESGISDVSDNYFTLTAPTPTNVSLAPTFRYDQKSIYHRLFIDFGSNGGRIKSISQVSPSGTCYPLTATVGQGAPNCSLGNASYPANSSCGVYLQMKSAPCTIRVEYYSGLSTRVAQFESYLPAGNSAGSGERIREVSDESASAATPSQAAAVIGLLQALINLLSGR